MNSTATPASVVLLDDGNLVLRYGSNSSPAMWQSFEHPTHTLLPGGMLGYNKLTNTKQILTSWKSIENPAVGLFSVEVDHNLKRYVTKWNRSVQYWAGSRWNGQGHRFSYLPELNLSYFYIYRYIDDTNRSYVTYSISVPSLISRTIIDVTRQIRQLLWSDITGKWNLLWYQPIQFCDVYAACGAFSVCNEQRLPSCNCLTSFEPRSLSNWNVGSYSDGCVRKTEVNCSVPIEKHVLMLTYVEKSFLSAFPENEALKLDESACRRSCLNYCVCNAYTFISNVCQHWNRENLNKISHGFVSDDSSVDKSKFNIKVASKDLPHHIKNKDVNLGAVVGSVAGSLMAFVYRDLKIATKNFSDKLGGGSFGSVFKGVLHDSSIVAVNKLESVSQGEKEFRSEVSTIGIIHHVNLVSLRGFCAQDFGLAKLIGRDFSRGHERNSHQSEDRSFAFFPSLAANVLMEGGDILSLLDSRLNREASIEEITKIFKVAFWCIQDEEGSRPSMSDVEHILEGVLDVSMPPIPQYVKYFADDMEDMLFFKQSSSIGKSHVQCKFTVLD
ncbi:hypothetical protein L1987_06200 [Smallanthus sonchifolius]|uniref:Uncharacterized protein n=1 Tax=Smallanthus sonchifolius TaxID=185202 RepID=A0ACB9JXG0_9ASTR|nr:hypothetical protein L1987_06200 [Smallanthus sonchifolius]